MKSSSLLPVGLGEDAADTEARRALVQRIVASPYLKRSDRLCSFLRYVSECSLSGRTDEINEQLIGVNVFGKPASYNTSEDNIVRTHARLLRQRLDEYFLNEGQTEPLRIQIPRGAYVPIFEVPQPTLDESTHVQEVSLHVLPAAPGRFRTPWKYGLIGATAGLIVGVLLTLGFRHLDNDSPPTVSSSGHALWAALFTKQRPTLIVVGDAGVLMYQNMAKTNVTVDEYAYHTYQNSSFAQTPPGYKWFPLALRTYTSFNEIEAIRYLTHLPEARDTKVRIVFARDLQADDLRHNNVILLGGPNYDPWEQVFASKLNFRMSNRVDQDGLVVNNIEPTQGESTLYTYSEGDPARRGYAVISLLDNLSGDGRVLLVQGTTALGDGMAAEFLEDGKDLTPVLNEARSGVATKNFEMLLETSFNGTSWTHWKVLAHRLH